MFKFSLVKLSRSFFTADAKDTVDTGYWCFFNLRDKYLKISLRYDNKTGGKLQTYYVKTKFRVSKR